jgi:hypothetical protein
MQPTGHSSTSPAVPPTATLITLRNPMIFPAHREVNVICAFPIKVKFAHDQHLILAANVAATFTVSHRTWISPIAPLEATFQRDWDRIPCELRVKVLEYNLTSDQPIREEWAFRDRQAFSLSETVYAHLAMGPSIADLVPEIFYSKNVFLIDLSLAGYILRPPTAYIRLLCVRLAITIECWDELVTLVARIVPNFPKLRHVTIQIRWLHPERCTEDFMKRVDQDVLHLSCPGEVIFVDPRHGSTASSLFAQCLRSMGLTQEEVERRITEAISFKQ